MLQTTVNARAVKVFGIIIRMYMEAGVQHSTPHFHAYYQKQAAAFGIYPIKLLGGNFPLRQKRLVEAWAELHQEELQKDWERLQSGKLPEPIDPLR